MGLPPLATTLRIFPSRAALEHALVEASKDGPVVAEGFVTFSGLADLLAGGARLAAGNIVLRLLVREVMKSGPEHFRAFAHDPIAVRTVHGALLELRTCGLTGAVLAKSTKKLSAELGELIAVLVAYENVLAEKGLVDDADKWRDAVLAIAKGELPPQLADVREVIVEGDADLFGSRRDALLAFAARGLKVTVRMPFDTGQVADFGWSEASLAVIEKAAQGSANLEVVNDPRPLVATPRVIHVPEPAEQARRVAATVAAWVAEGLPPDSIAVATPDPDGLGELILEAMQRFGIPAYARRGLPVGRVRRVGAIIAAMGLGVGGYRREELLDTWLALGELVDGASPSRVAREVRASGARSPAVRDYREALTAKASTRFHLSEDSGTRAGAYATAVEAFMERWASPGKAGSLREQLSALATLVAEVRRRPPPRVDPDDDDGLDALADVLGDMGASVRLLGSAPPSMSEEELHAWLKALLGERRLTAAGRRSGSVAIGTLDDIVGAAYRCVVIAGVDGEAFPRRVRPDVILTDAMRAELNRTFGVRLLQSAPIDGRPALENDARDRWLWREGLAAALEHVVVTYGVREGAEEDGRSDMVNDLLGGRGIAPEVPAPTYAEAAVVAGPQILELVAFGTVAPGPGIAAQPVAAARAARELCDGDSAEWVARRAAHEAAATAGRLPADLGDDDKQRLAAAIFGRQVSASSLDALGRCVYRHFGKYVLRLSDDDPPGLAPDGRDDGRAAHEALRYVYADIVENGGLAAARRQPEQTLERARVVFDGKRAEILREVPVHPAMIEAALAGAWRSVEVQLRVDLDPSKQHEPKELEYAFADENALRLKEPGGERELKVRGSVDRVDRAPDLWVTLDYKSSVQKVEPGRHFQLALYGAVIARDFARDGDRLSAAWRLLPDGSEKNDAEMFGGARSCDVTTFMSTLDATLWPRVNRLLAGRLDPDPAPIKICDTCDVRRLCRARDLDQDELDAAQVEDGA